MRDKDDYELCFSTDTGSSWEDSASCCTDSPAGRTEIASDEYEYDVDCFDKPDTDVSEVACDPLERYMAPLCTGVLVILSLCIWYRWYDGIVGATVLLICRQIYDLRQVRSPVSPRKVSPRKTTMQTRPEPVVPKKCDEVSQDAPEFWLFIRKYGWALRYAVNLDANGRVSATEPLILGWKKMLDPPEELPVIDDLASLFEGNMEPCDRDIWKYKASTDCGEVTIALNVSKNVPLAVRRDGVYVQKGDAHVLVNRAWGHVDYIWGVPNMASVGVTLYRDNVLVMSSADLKS